jgi:hypothetical protein
MANKLSFKHLPLLVAQPIAQLARSTAMQKATDRLSKFHKECAQIQDTPKKQCYARKQMYPLSRMVKLGKLHARASLISLSGKSE